MVANPYITRQRADLLPDADCSIATHSPQVAVKFLSPQTPRRMRATAVPDKRHRRYRRRGPFLRTQKMNRKTGAASRPMLASDLSGGDEMQKSVVDQVAKTLVDQANNVGESFRKASEFTSSVAGSVNDGMKTAKNAVKDGRDAVEDFIDDTARSVKRSPIQSVLISVTIGLAVGFLLGRGTSGK